MKMYAIFPNPKSGVTEKQLIETENYTQEELKKITLYDILFNNWETAAEATLADYRLKISLYINDYARNKFTNIISKKDLDEILDVIEPSLIEYHTLFHS